jgi:hypothetical protein
MPGIVSQKPIVFSISQHYAGEHELRTGKFQLEIGAQPVQRKGGGDASNIRMLSFLDPILETKIDGNRACQRLIGF